MRGEMLARKEERRTDDILGSAERQIHRMTAEALFTTTLPLYLEVKFV
ncbi:MAG: hypothetical protein ACYCVB_10190 [Bacilli bacterium]